jgi:hypothetical protein
LSGASFNAEVAELADAHGSGPCTRKGVGVRVPSSAPIFFFCSFAAMAWLKSVPDTNQPRFDLTILIIQLL